MMRPRTSTLIAGYPLVTVPLFLLDGFLGYLFTANEGFGFGTLLALLFAGWLANCAKEAARYRAWRQDWDALDPGRQPRQAMRVSGKSLKLLAALALVLGTVWLFVNYDDPKSVAHEIAPILVIVLPLLGIARLCFRRRPGKPSHPQAWMVTQAISRPLTAPSVAEAFARLPDYCRSPARKEQA